jgi:hypothetical protein
VTPTDRKERKRYEQVGQIVKDLKAVARELQVPVLALAQINREAEKQGKDTRPKLHQLREAGDIEQDADMVLLLHRLRGKQFEKKDEQTGIIETWDADLEVAKARLGSEARFRLDWHAACEQYAEHGFGVPGRVATRSGDWKTTPAAAKASCGTARKLLSSGGRRKSCSRRFPRARCAAAR